MRGVKLLVIRQISHGDGMHNMVSIVNNTVLLKRKDLSRAAVVKKRIRHMVGMKKRRNHPPFSGGK